MSIFGIIKQKGILLKHLVKALILLHKSSGNRSIFSYADKLQDTEGGVFTTPFSTKNEHVFCVLAAHLHISSVLGA